MEKIDLYAYIEHKIGSSIQEIIADSPERFKVIETEALRDLVVMNQIADADRCVLLHPETLQNPECVRLSKQIPHIVIC
jgi:shikimate kinase